MHFSCAIECLDYLGTYQRARRHTEAAANAQPYYLYVTRSHWSPFVIIPSRGLTEHIQYYVLTGSPLSRNNSLVALHTQVVWGAGYHARLASEPYLSPGTPGT